MDTSLFLQLMGVGIAYICFYAFAVRRLTRSSSTTVHAQRLARGDFVLGSEFFTSGDDPVVFLDADQVLADKDRRSFVVDWIGGAIEKLGGAAVFDRVIFIEKDSGPVGLFPIHHLVSERVEIPSCILRMKRLPWLPAAALKGLAPMGGNKVCLVSDVTTVGGHIERAIEAIQGKYWNAKVGAVVVLVNCDGGRFEKHLWERYGISLTVNEDLTREYLEKKTEKLRGTGEGEATDLRLVA